MQPPGVHLLYRYTAPGDAGQRAAQVENSLFDLLAAVQAQGSICHAAAALGGSYRRVWGALKRWEGELAQPLVTWAQGRPARLTPFALRLLWAERQARVRMTPHIEALRAELAQVHALALSGPRPMLEVFASHDLALPALQALAVEQGLHMRLRFVGSVDALRALAGGRCAVAGFHVPVGLAAAQGHERTLFRRALKPLLKPGRHKLIACARRTQGLMLSPGLPARPATLADVVRLRLRFVMRQPGSGTRLLNDELLRREGLPADALVPPSAGGRAHEDTHVAVAAAIARGDADAGLGIQAAAEAAGLDFVPLLAEDYHLVCLRDALDTEPLRQLRAVLAGEKWCEALQQLPGYAALPQAGQVLSLTRTLPWWRLRPRGASAPRGQGPALGKNSGSPSIL